MSCPTCHHDNREDAKFCEACGSTLTLSCPACGNQIRPGAAFCDKCGISLTAKPGKRGAGSEERRAKKEAQDLGVAPCPTLTAPRAEAERRQLTVMFCDLVGSTTLSEQLDPEEWRTVVQGYQRACAEVIARFEGYIAQYLGDGLLIYFGYPTAHEDDAQRAVRVGLEIISGLQKRDADTQPNVGARHAVPLQARIGIHTGLVVVGEMGGGEKREQLALGDTPNIAARLQGLAEPDTVVISTTTYRLIAGWFDCHDLGVHALKGLSIPIQVYQVVGEGQARSRLEVATATGLTPLVGREQEVKILLERWERVKEGSGQVVLLSGEPGIGKSRLAQVLKEQTTAESHARLEWRCSPYYQNSALYPAIEHLQRLLEFHRADSSEEKLNKLVHALEEYEFDLQETVPFLATLLSFPAPRFPLPVLTPQRQKQKTQEVLVTWLLKEAERQPVRLEVEDLHWADPSTLELLGLLIDQAPTTRILMLLTFRPEFRPPWALRSHLTQISLNRLAHKQVEALVEQVAGGQGLSTEVVRQIAAKTDGVPLFVEELTKTVVESALNVGAQRAAPLFAIPATLHDSLMARLDRLGSAKEIAQLGATLGREFSYELIQAASPVDETKLQRALAQLVDAELLYQRGVLPQSRYIFKHALIQDAAYQSLLKSTRQQYHKQIAQVLEERFSEIKETQPELLAHHCTEAGLSEQAIPCWQQAGAKAVERSANIEAISHLTKGLELLQTLPNTPERTQQELVLQTTLGHALTATKGWADPEVGAAYARSRELCQQGGDPSQLSRVLVGLWTFYVEVPQLQTAHELGEQLLSLAQKTHDQPLLAEAHLLLGFTLFFRGEIASARDHLQQGMALHPPSQGRSRAVALYGHDPRIYSWFVMACVLWLLGYPDRALKSGKETLALAQELSHAYSSAIALYWATMLHRLRRERQATQERAEALIALCTEQGFALFLAWGTILRGRVLAEQGEQEQGIAHIQQGLTAHQATGGALRQPYWLALLAEVHGRQGRGGEGLALLDEALATANKTGERWYEAELYRLKGELSLQSRQVKTSPESEVTNPQSLTLNPQSKAEDCFLKAIDIARKQSAKSLELRAVMSLSRLWQQQGKKAEAHQLLSEIYGWFTEGFDTKDLQDAKSLLENLSQ